MKIWQIPLRLSTGAFILNSGLSKRSLEGEAAEGIHGFAASGTPEVADMEPETFVKSLSTVEIVLGMALLMPVVPSGVVGVALTAFSLGLNRFYWKAPGLRQEGDVRPTEAGTAIAKDVWMNSIGVELILDALTDRRDA